MSLRGQGEIQSLGADFCAPDRLRLSSPGQGVADSVLEPPTTSSLQSLPLFGPISCQDLLIHARLGEGSK